MNIKNVLIYSSLRCVNNLFYLIKKPQLFKKVYNDNSKKKIYFFLKPVTPNTGDMAQDMCIEKWFNRVYPEYTVLSIPHKFTTNRLLDLIQRKIQPSDLIFFHSGFTMNDPNKDLYFILKIIPLFPNNKIVILPQTVDLISEEVKNNVVRVFDNHKDLTLVCRDTVSLERSKKLFHSCNLTLFPDFVTSMIGVYPVKTNIQRAGVLLVLRNDAEKYYSKVQLQDLIKRLKNADIKVDITDTLLVKSSFTTVTYRDQIIEHILDKFSRYQLIVTDRYHGLIFSQIVSVPVIVLQSTNHKLTSGIEWFPKEHFSNNLYFANNLEEVYQLVQKRLLDTNLYLNPPYFFEKYFKSRILR